MLLPSGIGSGTLLIDGACPYDGPGIVFEAPWDITGALRVRFNDPKLRANIATPNLEVKGDGIHTSIYGEETLLSYGPGLRALDLDTGSIAILADQTAAEEFFHSRPRRCPPAEPGVGVPIL
jgi:hypothetical protein